jgi:hypothetical protein
MPSVEMLENAIDILFEWLKERYVDTYKEIPLEQSVLQNVKLYIHNLIVDYMNVRYKKILMKKSKRISNTVLEENIETVTLNFRNETFETLLEDGYLIPSKEHLNAIGILPEEFIEQDNIDVPKSFLLIWMDFLIFCNNNLLLSLLFQKFLQEFRVESDLLAISSKRVSLRGKFLLSWINTLIKLNSYKNEQSKYTKFRFEFSFKEVCLEIFKGSPDKFCFTFLKEASKLSSFQSSINKSQYEKLYALVDLMNEENQDQVVAKNDESNQMEIDDQVVIDRDYEIFKQYKNRGKENLDDNNGLKPQKAHSLKSDWTLIDDNNWNYENLKLGLIENQSYNDLNLHIRQQFLKDTSDDDNSSLNKSCLSESLANKLNNGLNKSKRSQSLFAAEKLSQSNIETIKKSLSNNYWESS